MLSLEKKFFSILSREQFLLLVFLVIIFCAWATYLRKDWQEARQAHRSVLQQLDYQELILSEESAIEADLLSMSQEFDPAQLINQSQLSVRIERLADQAAVDFGSRQPTTEKGDIFSINRRTVSLNAKEIGKIILFTNLLQKESPYLRVNELKLSPQKANPTLLDADFIVSSLELNQSF